MRRSLVWERTGNAVWSLLRIHGCPRNCKRRARTKATGRSREGGKELGPASQETYRRCSRHPGGVPRRRLVSLVALPGSLQAPCRRNGPFKGATPGVALADIDQDE